MTPTVINTPYFVPIQSLPLQQELYGGEIYEYYPLGHYIVSAPQICGGRPTFKYTRLEVTIVLTLLAQGQNIEQLLGEYADSQLTRPALQEAIFLACSALVQSTQTLPLAA